MNNNQWDDIKEQVRAATDIVDLVGSYISLRRQGRQFVGQCPWHDDSRPSLQVNPERQTWKCWVCDLGGDVFSFVMKRESLDFRGALEMLAERGGVVLPQQRRDPSGIDKNALFRVLSWAERQFATYLASSSDAAVARDYLASRGIHTECVRRFRIGYSPQAWDWLLQRARQESFTDEQLQLAGLANVSETSKRVYDRFRGRLLFSIRDAQGRTVGFGGRVLSSSTGSNEPKYVNSPETRLFSKRELLYGLDLARDEISRLRHAIVVEGYTDALMAHQFGISNVVAVLGTALGQRHLELLRHYADRVTLLLDGDEAGQRRTNEILELFLKHAVDLRVATIPAGQDPCDFLLQYGREPFAALIAEATDALFHRIATATRGVDIVRDVPGAHRALEQILASLASLGSEGVRDVSQMQLKERQVLAYLARHFRIAEPDLRERLRALRANRNPSASAPSQPQSSRRPTLNGWDLALLELCIVHPEFIAELANQIAVDELQTESAQSLFAMLATLARQRPQLTFDEIMSSVEDADLKSFLVELDERGAKRSELANRPSEYLQQVLEAFQRRRIESECRSEIRRMESEPIGEAEQLDALQRILRQRRMQQGI